MMKEVVTYSFTTILILLLACTHSETPEPSTTRDEGGASEPPAPDETGPHPAADAASGATADAAVGPDPVAVDGGPGETPAGDGGTRCEPASYRTITLAAGEGRRFSVGSGETFENVLIDMTAPGADAHISASGDGWVIRNVGFEGAVSERRFSNLIRAEGNGVIDTVYMGDGVAEGVSKGAIGSPASHAGHIEVRNVYIAQWSSNSVYAAGMGRLLPPGMTDGAGGTLAFRGCYFRDNNIAHLRLASDGTLIEDTVIHNTNRVPPIPLTAGGARNVVNSRGIYTGYGDPSQVITVRNSHIDITTDNTNGAASAAVSGTHGTYGDCSTIRIVDSQVRGRLIGDFVETVNVGDAPDTTVPAGVPTTPEQAASGSAGCAGDPAAW